MRTALTVITTAILTAIAFLLAWQQGRLGNVGVMGGTQQLVDQVANTEGNANCLALEDGESCDTPWGETIAHGQAVLSFEAEMATGETACIGMTSICNDGAWLDDATPYTYPSCELDANAITPKNCPVGEVIVAHDTTNTFYKEIQNGSSYTYESQKRYCFDGELDGDASYTKLNLISSCTLNVVDAGEQQAVIIAPTPAPEAVVQQTTPQPNQPQDPIYARCAAPSGGVWTHGQGGTIYLQANVPYGSSCQATSVVCGYGTIRYGSENAIGDPVGETMFASCSVGEPVGCSSACGDIAHGEEVTTYKKGSITYGSNDTCNDLKVTSTCSNGSFSPTAGTACSCDVLPPAACTAPNGQQVAHGGSITLYKDETIQPVAWDGSDTCIRQGGKCENGVWYDWNGSPTTLTFKYPTCTILPPPAGEGPGGQGVPQG